jgi:hypothetical protein
VDALDFAMELRRDSDGLAWSRPARGADQKP